MMNIVPINPAYCAHAPGHPWHGPYHDQEYGFPCCNDAVLFERLSLEIFQAGLSWELVLKRRRGIFEAFAGFDPHILACRNDSETLLKDSRIIRNRSKIEAILFNAGKAVAVINHYGSLAAWLDSFHPLSLKEWVHVLRRSFRFIGPKIAEEFLVSLGYLPGAHREDCPIYHHILMLDPPWYRAYTSEVDPYL